MRPPASGACRPVCAGLAVLFLALLCGSTAHARRCKGDEDCKDDRVCHKRRCVKPEKIRCKQDGDCPGGRSCGDDRRCTAAAPPPAAEGGGGGDAAETGAAEGSDPAGAEAGSADQPAEPVPAEEPAGAGAAEREALVASWPPELVRRPLVLHEGLAEVQAGVLKDLSADFGGLDLPHPLFLFAAGWYGLRPDLSVGLGNIAICLIDCGDRAAFDSLSLDAYYRFHRGPRHELVAQPSLYVASFDPFTLAFAPGLLASYLLSDRLQLWASPRLVIPLTSRDTSDDQIIVTVQPRYQINQQLAALVTTGLHYQFDDDGSWLVPFGVGALYNLLPALDVAADFTLARVLGSDLGPGADIGPFDFRVFRIYVQYRFAAPLPGRTAAPPAAPAS